LNTVDNNSGTASNTDWWGLGLTDAGEQLGFIVTITKNTLADDQPADSIYSLDDGASWFKHHHMRPGRIMSVASTTDSSTPIDIEDVSIDLDVTAYIAAANGLTLTEDVKLDGSVTLEVTYD
jgi:hypothetical protein